MVIAIIVAFVVAIHLQCLVLVYLSLVKIKYSVCVCEKKKKALLKPFREFGVLGGMSQPFSLHDPAVNLSLLQIPMFRYCLASLCIGHVNLHPV